MNKIKQARRGKTPGEKFRFDIRKELLKNNCYNQPKQNENSMSITI